LKKTISNWLVWALIVVAFLGFLDATYLTVSHYTGSELACSLTGGCEEVTTSKYSSIFGIPVALLGALYYFFVLILALIYKDTRKQRVIELIFLMSTVGILMSAWFVYLQIFVIQAICQYCMVSAATSTSLFLFGAASLKYSKITNP
jgi:uncharacterized membrane protein